MEWMDIVSIVFVCVTANHLGLVSAIEEKTDKELSIIDCPKCFTFWCTLVYGIWYVGISDLPMVLAISFLASYAAIWLELLEGILDTIYMKVYEKIITTGYDDATATDADEGNTAGPVSEL